MNVFRSRKKSIGELDTSKRPSLDEAPPMPKSARSLFSRKKQILEDPKPALDLGLALPSDNEFRTSLIMPNLSQRFSMLREQDDPTSKLGKASDDSVLFPKRHSRLNLFEGQLDDIAEVSSLAGSFRPPFAQEGGRASFASDGGYDSDGGGYGSIMSRAKPGQGNKFFGGRQKVYKIPSAGAASKNSSRPGSAGRGKGMGRAVYEDDISQSLWQQLRQEEKAKRSFDYENDQSSDGRRSSSLSRYNRNRETLSSTNSNERSSTAATSLSSVADNMQGSMIKESVRDRPLNKRLYGQNFDQQVHDQQSSAVQRLNSSRNARGGFQTLAPARAPSASKRNGPISTVSSTSSLRSGNTSPGPASSNGFDFGLDNKMPTLNTRDVDSGYQGSPNFTPPISPADPMLTAHLNPNDLGKATASGAFNKPKARYDEGQFAQRQLQLQTGRETPTHPGSRSETPNEREPGRLRQDSDTSAGTGYVTPAQDPSHMPSDRGVSKDRDNSKRITGQALNGSYFAETDSDDEQSPVVLQSNIAQSQNNIHPALRMLVTDESGVQKQNFESPTLGAPTGGLSDMVRGHLRNVSDASSVYTESPPPEAHDYEPEEPQSPQATLADRAQVMLNQARRRAESNANSAGSHSQSPPAPKLRTQPSIDEMVQRIHHARGPSTETQQERDAFADELADRRRQVEEKLRNIAESRKQTETDETVTRDAAQSTGLTKQTSRGSLVEPTGAMAKLKKFMPGSNSASGSTTPIAEPDSPPQFPIMNRPSGSDPRDRTAGGAQNGEKILKQNRDIGAERRARHAESLRSPRGTGAPTPRGRVDARRQQFAGTTGNMTSDFTERVNANPDQGKPHFHPAGRARHYSPPRANQTPDQKPMLPRQASNGPSQRTPGSRGPSGGSRGPGGRSPSATGQGQPQYARQPSGDRANMITPPGARGPSPGQIVTSPTGGAQMITPGTYPAPVGSPNGAPMIGDLKYVTARKRSVSKADISTPTFLSGTYDTTGTISLPAGASLENGMAEVRAADAAMSPPPVPPINPRRRAMNTIKSLTRSNTGSPDGIDSRGHSPNTLRRQMSEGTSLRHGNSPVKGY